MDIEWAPLRTPDALRTWQEVLRPVAVEMAREAPVLARRLTEALGAEAPEFFPDADSAAEHVESNEAHFRLIAAALERGGDPRLAELPTATVAATRSGVHRQLALGAMLRSYRLGHETLWQWMFGRITARAADAAEQARAVDLASRWLFAYADAAVTHTERQYTAEREAWLRSATAARAEAIAAILAGRERDQRRAASRLRYELGRHHLGVIAWGIEASSDGRADSAVEQAVTAAGKVIGADATLTHPLGPQSYAAWLSRATPFTDADLDAARPAVPSGVRVALGSPAPGLDGFRRTHIEATHARRVVTLSEPHAAPVTRYRDVAVAALGTVDPEQARTFVTGVLGPLAADDAGTFRLAMTLATYLDENSSRSRTAERLMIHPNTVTYRVQQAKQILGRGIDSDTLDLRVALALLPTLRGLPPGQ
ncbi:helix-turn-helix domain-containing protein [Streptomyces sp. GXMU-J15]|uniref:Helix-turn-helix domain-containing protein n=1 Tax=Streptomyces fuscus TaxID=3048495 RepID=A0ABT7J042_9ACTN|nr:helix-turn-helix domain-containing protein [Streptomyces fuscus]MDL2078205.1 helix-turn-helix domain-containing protein [Streptomyces fuscus]